MSAAPTTPATMPSRAIRWWERSALGVAALASWVTGGIATFMADNGAGAAALVGAGSAAGLLALVGRWPSRLSFSGNEVVWEEVRDTLDRQIAAVESSEQPQVVIDELKRLRGQLAALERTGVAPPHPAEQYDMAVEQALRDILPGVELHRQARRNRRVADFLLKYQGQEVLIETKWRSDPEQPFQGRTLDQLLDSVRPGDRLLVVVNAREADNARKALDRLLPGTARLARWRSEEDNAELKDQLLALLNATPVADAPKRR